MIETTINLNVKTLDKINKISCVTNISRSRIIKDLLKKVMHSDMNSYHINRSVKYQKSDIKKNWHKFHIILDPDEYEFFLDLRKLLKRSISAIVAFAVKKYYKEIIGKKTIDNYLFKNYIILKEKINNVISWRLFWGYPEKMEKILSTQQTT